MKTRDEDETANLIWSDSAVQQEKIAELRNYQVILYYKTSELSAIICTADMFQ